MGVSIPGQDSADSVYVDILNSRSLRETLLQTSFKFKVRTWYFGTEQAREQTLYEYLAKKNLDRAVKALKERITITRDLKTKLITLAVETESPQLSQLVTQRLVRLLDEFVVTKSQTRGGAKAAFAVKRVDEAREEMAQAEEVFRAFLNGNRNYLMSPDPSVRLKGIRLENELKLRTQLVTNLAISREQALLEEKNDMPILNVLDAGNLPIDKSGPPRLLMVLGVVILLTASSMAWRHRDDFKAFLRAAD
jgi:capsule polysaccharide export protein KpsE/RkpR